MDNAQWQDLAEQLIDYLVPYASVILLGLESARRMLGQHIDRTVFVNARSVYALLKATFERDQDRQARQLLDDFVKAPAQHRDQLVALLAQRARSAPGDLGRKLIAIAARLRAER